MLGALRRCVMRMRMFVGAALLTGVVAASTLDAVPVRRTATVRFLKPTLVAGAVWLGPVVLEQDEAKTANGEPCTTVYHYKSESELGEPIVSFMCAPKVRPLATKFEARIDNTVSWPAT